MSTSPATPNGKALDAAGVDERYRCGSLVYTKASLAMLFGWMIWGSLCFNLFEQHGGYGVMNLYLQHNFQVSNLTVNILFNVIPMIMGTIMTPIISFKSDRTRSRWGRRIPYMLFTAPFLSLFAAAIGYSDDVIQYCKHYVPDTALINPFTVALFVIAFMTIGYTFFNEFVGCVYYYLLPDVMPKAFIGRYQGVAQMASTASGIAVSLWILPYQLTHIKAIHVGLAVLYFVGLSLMCLFVKEGEYPPVEDVTEKTKFTDQVRLYFRECFAHPIFILFYISVACTVLTRGLNPAGVFSLHLDEHQAKVMAHEATHEPVAVTAAAGFDPLQWLTCPVPPYSELQLEPAQWMISAGQDGLVKVWERADGAFRMNKVLTRPRSPASCIAVNRDSGLAAIASAAGHVEIWDFRRDRQILTIPAHAGQVTSLAFSADGMLLASAGADNTIRVWRARSGGLVTTLSSHQPAGCVALSLDGRLLASAGDGSAIRLWDVPAGRIRRELSAQGGALRSLSLSADGGTLASCATNGSIQVWDTAAGTAVQQIRPKTAVEYVVLSADAAELAGYSDGGVQDWRVSDGAATSSFGVQMASTSMAMTPDGTRALSGGKDGKVVLWDRTQGKQPARLRTFESQGGAALAVAISADGRTVAAGSLGGLIEVWNAADGRSVHRLTGHVGAVQTIAMSKDGTRLASGGADGTVRMWDLAGGKALWSAREHVEEVNCLAFSSDERQLVSGGADRRILIWDAASGRLLKSLEGSPGPVYAVCFAPALGPVPRAEMPQRGWLRTQLHKTLFFLREVFTNESLYTVPVEETSRIVAQDGWVVSGGRDGAKDTEYARVRIWDVADGRMIRDLKGHKQAISSVLYKPDLRVILSASRDASVRLWKTWDISEQPGVIDQSFKAISGYTRGVTGMAAVDSGEDLVNSSTDGTLHVWNINRGVSLARNGLRGIFFALAGLVIAWPIGVLVDRWNPIRIYMACSFIGLFFTLSFFFWYHSYVFGLWVDLLRMPFNMLASWAAVPMSIILYPKTKYGQFASANALVRQAVAAIAGPTGAILMDQLTNYALDTDYFRYGYLFQFVAHGLSLLAMLGVYYYWKKLGGDNYVAPEVHVEPAAQPQTPAVAKPA